MSRLGTFSLPVLPPRQRPRRGVLLLVCLSMLTLFMLLGTTYMVVTSRARATARAFARSSSQQFQAGGGDGQRLLDDALLAVVRGQVHREDLNLDGKIDHDIDRDGQLDPPAIPVGDDLLGDRYGFTASPAHGGGALPQFLAIRGTITGAAAGPGTALATIAVNFDQSVPHPAVLAGRVFTLISPELTWSTRILRAEGTSTASALLVALDARPGGRPATLAELNQAVADGEGTFLINGREFTPPLDPASGSVDPLATNEPYDGFDDENPFLAKLLPVKTPGTALMPGDPEVGTAECVRPSFEGSDPTAPSPAPEVDNDGDGVPDSIWLDLGMPVQSDGSGGFCRPRAAVLVVDLDGRINANLHGTIEEADLLAGMPWPPDAEQFPAGSGYGPPEIRLGDLFRVGGPSGGGTDPAPDLRRLMEGGTATGPAAPDAERPFFPVIASSRGRYGSSQKPGRASEDDPLSGVRDQRRGRGGQQGSQQKGGRLPQMQPDWLTAVGPAADAFASPPDLKGMMKVFTINAAGANAVVPTLCYAKPRPTDWIQECVDDPYEIRPGQDSADDALFSADELERILRIYDWDIAQLPPRLAAVLGPHAERLRLLLTTEQWDTTAIVGDAWTAIEQRVCMLLDEGHDKTAHDFIAPELIGGRRFDLNRPVASQQEADRFCRGLYTLLWFLADDAVAGGGGKPGTGVTPQLARQLAQWTVNVLDFRDADSIMTGFTYDLNPLDGWDPSEDDVVWGVERPEMVITEAVAWQAKAGQDGGVYVMLHRPWHTENFAGADSLAGRGMRVSDRVDPRLDTDPSKPTNILDLAALGGGDDESPVWRLSIEGMRVRFDDIDDPDDYSSSDARDRTLPTNGWACVYGSSGTPAGGTVSIANNPAIIEFQVDRPGPLKPPAGQTEITISIERLADPTRPHDEENNPYRAIDSMTVAVSDRTADPETAAPLQNYAKQSRDLQAIGGFWAQPGNPAPPTRGVAGNSEQVGILTPGGNPAFWFPFLNRPLVSVAELALVPPADSENLLVGWTPPEGNGMLLKLVEDLGVTDADTQRQLISNILAATTIPSRFAGVLGTADDSGAGGGPGSLPFGNNSPTGLDQLVDGQFAGYREPGRVNLNTVTDQRVWDATVLRGSLADYPQWPAAMQWSNASLGGKLQGTPAPAKTALDVLGLQQNAATIVNDDAQPGPDPALNPQFHYLTANRLANVATNRSHVFAIWVTIGFFEWDETSGWIMSAAGPREVGADTGQIRRHRAFYIVDRSIPVAYETGRDHNVRDIIRLRRIIQ